MKPSNAHYKNFKKKTSTLTVDPPKERQKNNDIFGDLRSKLEKEKESVKKTGRRFRQQTSVSTEAVSVEVEKEKNLQTDNSKNCQISVGPDAPVKQNISLCDIAVTQEEDNNEAMMRSSKMFEREVKQQKKRNDDIFRFLQSIELQKFTEGLISSGFDDLETLAEVQVEDLNHLMMRAHQQDRLIEALKKMNLREEKKQQSMTQSQVTGNHWRAKTQAGTRLKATIKSDGRIKTETIEILQRLKTAQTSRNREKEVDKKEGENKFKTGSFLYSVGSRNWGVEDQVRRACSTCFRVEQQMEKKGECYYCSRCYKMVAQDLLTISLNTSMNRSYKFQGK